MSSPRQLNIRDYTVGWICALPIELAAAQEMLDEIDQALTQDSFDPNNYTLGRIGMHNVVMACLPAGSTGTQSAATVATRMKSKFTSIRFGLMVGIGGGVPSFEADVRLGDVVISLPYRDHGGVVQYDFGKTGEGGRKTRTGWLNAPPPVLLHAISQHRALEFRGISKISNYMAVFETDERLERFKRDAVGPDVLFERTYTHVGGPTCSKCDEKMEISRRARKGNLIKIHYGTIASGNQVMKDGVSRDKISDELGGVICFEMEAAGLMNDFPCLVIRGICDYADSHKHKDWQPYAAATAAASAKEILSIVPPAEIARTPNIPTSVEDGGQEKVLSKLEQLFREMRLGFRNADFMNEWLDRTALEKELVDDDVTVADVEESREVINEWLKNKATLADPQPIQGNAQQTIQRDSQSDHSPQTASPNPSPSIPQPKPVSSLDNCGRTKRTSPRPRSKTEQASPQPDSKFDYEDDLDESGDDTEVEATDKWPWQELQQRFTQHEGGPARRKRRSLQFVNTEFDILEQGTSGEFGPQRNQTKKQDEVMAEDRRKVSSDNKHSSVVKEDAGNINKDIILGKRIPSSNKRSSGDSKKNASESNTSQKRESHRPARSSKKGPFDQLFGLQKDWKVSSSKPREQSKRQQKEGPINDPKRDLEEKPNRSFESVTISPWVNPYAPVGSTSLRSSYHHSVVFPPSPSFYKPVLAHKENIEAKENEVWLSLEQLFTGTTQMKKISRKIYEVGSGEYSLVKNMLPVSVKKGLKDGQVITFNGYGDEVDGKPTDLKFFVREKPHPLFERSGDDLIHGVEISVLESLVGWERTVHMIDGVSLDVIVECSTPHSWETSFKEFGMPLINDPHLRGLLIIKVTKINYPGKLSSQQKEKLRESLS
ncbi:hypothetical protein B0J11DRAFT_194 [Dendryphion nanum]|uniref:Nucleoside phosphorylase domain-containing protein n=1 Tax=Dendryphion nanum TaxID=256645 RepID=A0A9P9EIY4_9PLEO|nr:hypothetical protein B0J11DRAFT_194 [Dendryphion nanum]